MPAQRDKTKSSEIPPPPIAGFPEPGRLGPDPEPLGVRGELLLRRLAEAKAQRTVVYHGRPGLPVSRPKIDRRQQQAARRSAGRAHIAR